MSAAQSAHPWTAHLAQVPVAEIENPLTHVVQVVALVQAWQFYEQFQLHFVVSLLKMNPPSQAKHLVALFVSGVKHPGMSFLMQVPF